jgi:serine/threonine protein kinase
MPLSSGTRVGVYEIGAVVGQGGMGVVYRAVDTNLRRAVAIKVLSAEVADPAARRRFQREAQTASSLNHPHILTVHDAGEVDGQQYLVTEFLDGGTLRDRMNSRDLTWRAAIELLVGVADALAVAHDAGILHRDVKPENILLTKSGYAKLADFGLARPHDEGAPQHTTRTEDWSRTRPGSIVGTVAYMSPEQAAGRPLDSRSDVFSFGLVLYEILGGRRAFSAASDADVLHAIMHDAPAPLPGTLPHPLRDLVAKALEKNPSDRFQSMRDMVVDMKRVLRQDPNETQRRVESSRTVAQWIAGGVAVLAIAAVGWSVVGRPARAPSPDYTALTTFADSVTSPVISPDGRMLAMLRKSSAFSDGPAEIFVKQLPEGDVRQLTNDGLSKADPEFSSDGRRISYHTSTDGKVLDVWSVAVDGGSPELLVKNASGLTWIESAGVGDERLLFSEFTGHGFQMAVVAADSSGTRRRTVYLPPLDGMAHRSQLSPDGKWVLVVEMDIRSWLPCRLVPFDGSTRGSAVGPIPSQCTSAAWSADGRWMYFAANTGDGTHVWRQRFPDGPAEQATRGATEEDEVSFDRSSGTLVAAIGSRQSTIWIHDNGRDRQLTSEGFAFFPAIGPDSNYLYYLTETGNSRGFLTGGLWSLALATGERRALFGDFDVMHYTISNDGTEAVFAGADQQGQAGVWVGALNGGTPPRQVTRTGALVAFFGAPGEIIFADSNFIYRVKNGGAPQKISLIPSLQPFAVSPDGKWISAAEGPSPETRNALMLYPTSGGEPRLVCRCYPPPNIDDGPMPPAMSWSPDGRFVYVRFAPAIYAIPLRPKQIIPEIPASGWPSTTAIAALPGARLLSAQAIFPGPNPSVYAYMKVTAQRNIYRVPVP